MMKINISEPKSRNRGAGRRPGSISLLILPRGSRRKNGVGRKAIRETTWGKQSGAENARGGEKDEGAAGHGSSLCEECFSLLSRGTLSSCCEERFFPPWETVPSCQAGGNVLK